MHIIDDANQQPDTAEVHSIPGVIRCNRCLLPFVPTSDQSGPQNMCRLCCNPHSGAGPTGDKDCSFEKLDAVINGMRSRGVNRKYDAVIGLSGGRDSSYMAYLLVHEHRLRCLACYYRTPFTQDITDANVRRIALYLDIPLIEMHLPEDEHIQVARSYFLRWCEDPQPAYAGLCCAVCKFVNREVYRIAREYSARTIVFAGNMFEAVPFLPTFDDNDSIADGLGFRAQARKMITVVRKGVRVAFSCPPLLLPTSFKAAVMYLNPHSPYLRLRNPHIHSVDYFYYAKWSESACVDTIQKRLGWQPSAGSVDTWKSDCDFAAVKNYMFYKMYGATYTDALYSNLIRAGQMSQDVAVSRIRAGAGLSMKSIERAMSRMGLPMTLINRKVIEAARRI